MCKICLQTSETEYCLDCTNKLQTKIAVVEIKNPPDKPIDLLEEHEVVRTGRRTWISRLGLYARLHITPSLREADFEIIYTDSLDGEHLKPLKLEIIDDDTK